MAAVFTVSYWGTTGTLAAPLRPDEVMEKIRQGWLYLAQHNRLGELGAMADDRDRFHAWLAKHLPFHLRSTYGGNTTCVELQTPDALVILDCGTGFRELGISLESRWNAPEFRGRREAHVMVTHAHIDHTSATPFFDPYLDPRNDFTLYGSASVMKSFDAVLNPSSTLSRIFFPATYDFLKAMRRRVPMEGGQEFSIGSTKVSTINLRHPGGCLGFRFECQGRSFVFCTDHEHVEVPDPGVVSFARGADVLYLDGQYLAEELEGRQGIMNEAPMSRRGWGHSSVEASVATAVAAGVRQLHLGHREPKRDDADLARVEAWLNQCLTEALGREAKDSSSCQACIPFEGMTLAW